MRARTRRRPRRECRVGDDVAELRALVGQLRTHLEARGRSGLQGAVMTNTTKTTSANMTNMTNMTKMRAAADASPRAASPLAPARNVEPAHQWVAAPGDAHADAGEGAAA